MKKIIVFGAGETKGGLNKYAIRKAKKMGIEVLFLVDNDEKKHNTIFVCDNIEYKILSTEDITKSLDEDTFIIIATEVEHKEIYEQLIKLGIDKDKFSYIKGMEGFYNHNEHLYEQVGEGCWGKIKDGKIYPVALHIDLTTYCNLKCEYCGVHGEIFKSKNIKNMHMEMKVFKEIVRQVKEYNSIKEITNVRSGEIFMHPQWFEMCQYIAENTEIPIFLISTNGMLLNEQNIDKLLQLKFDKITIRVSLDGRNKEENDSYRKGSKYDVVKGNVHKLLERMDSRFKIIIFNTLLTSEDKSIEVMNGSLSECQYLVDEFGDRVSYYSAPARILTPDYQKYKQAIIERMQLSGIKIMKRDRNGRACPLPFYAMAFDVEGNILMCNCEPDRDVIIGNIMKDNAIDVYNGEFMNKVRECYKNGKSVKQCEGCNLNRGEEYYEYILCK